MALPASFDLRKRADFYRGVLLDDVVPFWLRHGLDRTHGGILTCLDRDGSVLDTDKGIWQQGRFTWLMGHLYNRLEPREEWLDAARLGIRFLADHATDPADQRMWFHVTRDGRPIRKRRYSFSEAFAAMAFAEWARATGDEEAAQRARDLFRHFIHYNTTPGLTPPKCTETRPLKSIGFPMIAIGVAQVLRDALGDPTAEGWIRRCIEDIERDFVRPEEEAVLESVSLDGEIVDHFDGRLLNPGHAIEGAWFILEEARIQGGDPHLIRLGCRMLDWMWERGWDREYGGIYYFRDLHHKPVAEYWHDMKFWWPQNETVIATLLAWRLTGNPRYASMYNSVHDWSFQHFPDPEFGEWFGHLHRDGRRSVSLKGSLFKGPFHLPRMLLQGLRYAGPSMPAPPAP